jgi:hypothetical protein
MMHSSKRLLLFGEVIVGWFFANESSDTVVVFVFDSLITSVVGRRRFGGEKKGVG